MTHPIRRTSCHAHRNALFTCVILFLLFLMAGEGMTMSDTLQVGEGSGGFSLWYMCKYGEVVSNQLSIRTDGAYYGIIRYSQAGMPVRGLGVYYLPSGKDDGIIARIGKIMRKKKLVEGPSYSVPPTFGIRSKVFEFQADGKTNTHKLNADDPLPEPLEEVDAAVDGLFSVLDSGPQRTLSISVKFEPQEISTGKNLKVSLEFRNRGKFPTDFRNPAAFSRGSGPNILRLNFWTKGTDDNGEKIDVFQWTMDLAGKEFLTGEREAIPSNRPLLRLPPGGTMRAWVNVKFPKCKPGSYLVEPFYYSAPSSGEEEKNDLLVTGEYHADPIPLSVIGGGKR